MSREYRKLYAIIRESEKLAACSMEARWLWTLLLTVQDDAGVCLWTPSKIRSLTVSTDWLPAASLDYMKELAANGLIEDHGDYIVLMKGEGYNGTPSNARGRILYDVESRAVTTQPEHSPDSASAPLEESREEERKGEESPAHARARKPSTRVTAEFKARMVKEWGARLGGEASVLERIERAMNNRASDGWKNKQKGIQDWLRSDWERMGSPEPTSAGGGWAS